jgi:hypothetical protein
MSALFLNVDLDIRAGFDLAPLRDAMGNRVSVLYCSEIEPGIFLLSVESTLVHPSSPDIAANSLCQVIEDLDEQDMEYWTGADERVFDLGFDAIIDNQCGQPLLSSHTLQRVSRLNASLALSVYTHDLRQAHPNTV